MGIRARRTETGQCPSPPPHGQPGLGGWGHETTAADPDVIAWVRRRRRVSVAGCRERASERASTRRTLHTQPLSFTHPLLPSGHNDAGLTTPTTIYPSLVFLAQLVTGQHPTLTVQSPRCSPPTCAADRSDKAELLQSPIDLAPHKEGHRPECSTSPAPTTTVSLEPFLQLTSDSGINPATLSGAIDIIVVKTTDEEVSHECRAPSTHGSGPARTNRGVIVHCGRAAQRVRSCAAVQNHHASYVHSSLSPLRRPSSPPSLLSLSALARNFGSGSPSRARLC